MELKTALSKHFDFYHVDCQGGGVGGGEGDKDEFTGFVGVARVLFELVWEIGGRVKTFLQTCFKAKSQMALSMSFL